MITKQSTFSNQCHHISTKGLDILCIAAELELESLDKTTNYCTPFTECSNNNNVNNTAKCFNVKKDKNIGRKLCTHEGCTTRSRGDGLCLKHGSTRNKFVTCRHDGCNKKAQFKGCVEVTEEKSARLKDVQTSASIEITVANTPHYVQVSC